MSTSYPELIAVPKTISDEILKKVFQFRKMGRIPALTWSHRKNLTSIVRCSQPQVGLSNDRCEEDELLLNEILKIALHSKKIFILDARPKVNAMANQAKGDGYENMAFYENTEIKFLDVENIHQVRSSLTKLHSFLYPTNKANGKPLKLKKWAEALSSSLWMYHIKTILKGAIQVAQLIDSNSPVGRKFLGKF